MNRTRSDRLAADDISTELDEHGSALVAELRRLRAANREITARETQVRAALIEALEGAELGCVEGHVLVRAERSTQRRVDVGRLRDEFPDVADWCTREVPVTTLRLP